MSTALYRRYRPETFQDIVGEEHVTEPLMAGLKNNNINHAYLFSGPRGTGKTTSARVLARCLNCEKGPTDTPCGHCASCIDLSRDGTGSLDVIEIDAASHGGVDDARDLRERATFAPARDRYKIFIIDEAHMVTPAGFNALLKIVEEPPEHVKFIFATTEPDKVIGTIRSRTHHYPFRLVPPAIMSQYIEKICAQEGIIYDPEVIELAVRAGEGSVRDTLSVLDQLIAGAEDKTLNYSRAAALLGYTPSHLLDSMISHVGAHDGNGVLSDVSAVIQSGQDPRRFVEDLLERFRDLLIVTTAPDKAHSILSHLSPERVSTLINQSQLFGPHQLSRNADVTHTTLGTMTGATSPRLHLELLAARLLLPASDHSSQGVAARLDAIEKRQGESLANSHHISNEPATDAANKTTSASTPSTAAEQNNPSSTISPSDTSPYAGSASAVTPQTQSSHRSESTVSSPQTTTPTRDFGLSPETILGDLSSVGTTSSYFEPPQTAPENSVKATPPITDNIPSKQSPASQTDVTSSQDPEPDSTKEKFKNPHADVEFIDPWDNPQAIKTPTSQVSESHVSSADSTSHNQTSHSEQTQSPSHISETTSSQGSTPNGPSSYDTQDPAPTTIEDPTPIATENTQQDAIETPQQSTSSPLNKQNSPAIQPKAPSSTSTSMAQVETQWPQIIERLSHIRKSSSALVSQIEPYVDGNDLILPFDSEGLKVTFDRGGNEIFIAQAIEEVTGLSPHIIAEYATSRHKTQQQDPSTSFAGTSLSQGSTQNVNITSSVPSGEKKSPDPASSRPSTPPGTGPQSTDALSAADRAWLNAEPIPSTAETSNTPESSTEEQLTSEKPTYTTFKSDKTNLTEPKTLPPEPNSTKEKQNAKKPTTPEEPPPNLQPSLRGKKAVEELLGARVIEETTTPPHTQDT